MRYAANRRARIDGRAWQHERRDSPARRSDVARRVLQIVVRFRPGARLGSRFLHDLRRQSSGGDFGLCRNRSEHESGAADRGRARRVARARRYSQTDVDVGRRRRLLVSEHPSPLLPQGRRHLRHAPRQRRDRRHHVIGNRAADGRGLSIPVQPRLARRAILPLFGGCGRRRREVQRGTGGQ